MKLQVVVMSSTCNDSSVVQHNESKTTLNSIQLKCNFLLLQYFMIVTLLALPFPLYIYLHFILKSWCYPYYNVRVSCHTPVAQCEHLSMK